MFSFVQVETLRKPSTGLKLGEEKYVEIAYLASRHSENPARD